MFLHFLHIYTLTHSPGFTFSSITSVVVVSNNIFLTGLSGHVAVQKDTGTIHSDCFPVKNIEVSCLTFSANEQCANVEQQ